MGNATKSFASASDGIPSKSPILHAIHILTNDPGLHQTCSEETQGRADAGADGCVTRRRMTAAIHNTTACGLGFASAFCLLAVTKVIADKSPGMQGSFQQKWAHLETSVAGLCVGGVNCSSQACKAVKSYVQKHQDYIRSAGKRAFKVLLVGLSLLAMKSRPGFLLTPAKLLLSPTCLVATAATTALLSHKPALGVNDPYKRARSQLTAASGALRQR
jgi:hypothetical protein